jgi:IclR family transcriptional regulator, pca regulon regulatory protein
VAGPDKPAAAPDPDGTQLPDRSGRPVEFVQSLERGLAVIRAFDADSPALTVSDVARITQLTRAAARRFLLTLVDLGYIRSDGRMFALTPRVLELGYAYLGSISLPEVALPHMERLVAEVHESCSVSVLDATDIVYVARVPTRRIMTVAITVGTRFPAYATSMGRVLLSGLDEAALEHYLSTTERHKLTPTTVTDPDALRSVIMQVRLDGWCLVDQELEVGLRSLAVPIHGAGGEVVAALNVSAPASRDSAEGARQALLPALQATAKAVSADLAITERSSSGTASARRRHGNHTLGD